MAQVKIDIATEFTGKKAFKDADTSVDKLTKNVKGLAKGLLAVYSAQKILSYAKSSVKAFAEDNKAATALGTTLKNLGLAYGSNVGTVNGFISRLEMQTGVLDDELRPAMDRLLRATGDVTKSQELLGLALDIAAGTGKSVTQVSQSLQKAYLGQTQALGRLGVGLTKAELSTSTFEEIQARLATLFAGQATAAADTYAGSLAKLTIAGNNAKETIGQGLVDALKTASGSNTIDPVIKGINSVANAIANLTRETGEFIAITRENFDLKNLSFFAKDINAFKGMGNISLSVSSQDTQKADAAAVAAQKKITTLTRQQAAAQAKIVKDKKLAAAIDKANLLLGKGGEVFDLEAIQLNAAMINQAKQLGDATSAAQELAIMNDIARLNVKRSMYDLEQAILSGDVAAIEAASAKLNKDLEILATLTGQNAKLIDIKSLLEGMKPKDLIDQANLNEALLKIKEILALMASAKALSLASIPKSGDLGSGIPSGDYISPIDTKGGSIAAILEYAEAAAARADAFAKLLDMDTEAKTNALRDSSLTAGSPRFDPGSFRMRENAGMSITVNTGVGDPNAIAEAVNQVLQDAIDRGTLRGGLYL